MKKRNATYLLLLLVASFLQAQQEVAFLRVAKEFSKTEFTIEAKDMLLPFELDRGMVYVQAQVNTAATGQYVLDTGAPGLVLNELPLHTESVVFEAHSSGDAVTIGTKQVAEFRWAGGRIQNFEAITLDLSHLEQAREASVEGMIGYDLLKRYTLLLDYAQGQLALLRPRPWQKWSEQAPLARIPFRLSGHLPVIALQKEGRTLHLGIDTGAGSNLLASEWAAKLPSTLQSNTSAEVQGLDQKVKTAEVLELTGLTDGTTFTCSDTFLTLDFSHLNQGTNDQLDGLLGYPFLSQYTIAIDYRRQEVLLWPKATNTAL